MHFSRFDLLIIIGVMGFTGMVTAADDYLSAIEAESGKVGVRHDKVLPEKKTLDEDNATEGSSEASDEGAGRDHFEQVLKQRYHGSFVFYQKLPERSREEIYEEYANGTPFVVIRKKIIDRFMQR